MASDRLTITITGPQGSGKTLLAEWLAENLPKTIRNSERMPGKTLENVLIIDIDGHGGGRRETQL